MLPKLTLSGIPQDIFDEASLVGDSPEVRERQKKLIQQLICAKETSVKKLHDAGHTLEVVYIRKYTNYNGDHVLTVAIKVSPAIRRAIKELQNDTVYIGTGSYKCSDRYFIIECYHCQMMGHIAKDCPNAAKGPVCKYCMKGHKSATCPDKSSLPCCAKCFHSTEVSVKDGRHSHTSGSVHCPIIQRETQRLEKNTELADLNML